MDFEDRQKDIRKYINGLKAPNFKATYTDRGFQQAVKILNRSSRRKDKQVAKVILLLTDGIPTYPSNADRWV